MIEDAKKEIIDAIKGDQMSLHDIHGLMEEMLQSIHDSKIPKFKGYGGGCGCGTGGGC